MWTADQLLAVVALINAVGVVVTAIIHAMRVPYRESAAKEQIAAADSMIRVRAQRGRMTDIVPPPPPPEA